MSKNSPGTIAYLTTDLARYDEFYQALMRTERPEGTEVHRADGADIVAKLNDTVAKMKGDWLWLLGDDHVWHPNLLMDLLAHDVDVVAPICLRRKPPFSPTVFKNEPGEEVGSWKVLNLSELPLDTALMKVEGRIGTAGMLIRKRVLDKLGWPWFEVGKEFSFLLQEDIYFCRRIQDAGFDVYCDLVHPLGHIFRGVVWPVHNGQVWGSQLELGPKHNLNLFHEK